MLIYAYNRKFAANFLNEPLQQNTNSQLKNEEKENKRTHTHWLGTGPKLGAQLNEEEKKHTKKYIKKNIHSEKKKRNQKKKKD